MKMKIKKAVYKKWWFYGLVILVTGVIMTIGSGQANRTNGARSSTSEHTKQQLNASEQYDHALTRARLYADTMYMSKQGIYKQLTSKYGEGLDKEAVKWAITQLVVDWKYNALQKAKHYQTTFSMSNDAIYRQLMSEHGEQFTEEETQYAMTQMIAKGAE